MTDKRKIINDPVYGFITLDHPLVLQVVAHPFYQRLRRIHQMALAQLVYPGAVHTRLHHSLGAYHLMCLALDELKRKKVEISPEEEVGAKLAILLHDVGHGPYSHALEGLLVPDSSHETMSILIMRHLDFELGGQLDTAIQIFTGKHPKKFLHQLVSGQLDVDRMDYLSRDSFFTGVSEGVIGYDRILKMLAVHEGELMVEEKAIYSIEKFLMARRLMYWQAYLHKTVLAAEQMLIRIVTRARHINAGCHETLAYFLNRRQSTSITELLEKFCAIDDVDVMMAIKIWQFHDDKVLSTLCKAIIDRKLLKIRLQAEPFSKESIVELRNETKNALGVTDEEVDYLVFTGIAKNTIYNPKDERINILFRDKTVKDISAVDNPIIQQSMTAAVGKHYICWPRVGEGN
jgi:HD superfamily phosphohydrolase